VMRCAGDGNRGARLRGLVVVLWRAGLRIHEALLLTEHDLDERRGSIVVRRGKRGRRRGVGMDDWGWEHLRPWTAIRQQLPYGPLFCVVEGPRVGGAWPTGAARAPRCIERALALRCAGASRRSSGATRTRSNSPAKASRSTSSNVNSDTATSA
jgi:integrase